MKRKGEGEQRRSIKGREGAFGWSQIDRDLMFIDNFNYYVSCRCKRVNCCKLNSTQPSMYTVLNENKCNIISNST